MINSGHAWGKGAELARGIVVVVVLTLLLAGRAYAQASGERVAAQAGDFDLRTTRQPSLSVLRVDRARWLVDLDDGAALASKGRQAPAFQASPARRQRSIGRKVAGGAIGVIGGFFIGGYLGAKIESPCHCDDPGLQGAMIGAPVGAVIGGILGARFF